MNNPITPSPHCEERGKPHQPISPSPRFEEKGPGDEELGTFYPRLHSASPLLSPIANPAAIRQLRSARIIILTKNSTFRIARWGIAKGTASRSFSVRLPLCNHFQIVTDDRCPMHNLINPIVCYSSENQTGHLIRTSFAMTNSLWRREWIAGILG